MPVFSRRRLQAMLNSLSEVADGAKQRDFIARLNQKRTKDAIAAEMEVALLWAINEVADLEIEPKLVNSPARPDAGSNNLFGDRKAVIEIRTLSDDFLGGEDAMRKISTRFAQFANTLVRKAERHLYFRFEEEGVHVAGQYVRRRLANPASVLAIEHKEALRAWLGSGAPPSPAALRLVGDGLDVTVEWQEHVHPQFNFFSTMPAVTYSLEDNSVYKALKKKEQQLQGVSDNYLRCVFIADGGCSLIRDIGSPPVGQREVRGEQIIEHFISNSSIDMVCTFSPTRVSSVSDRVGKLKWTVQRFGVSVDYSKLHQLVEVLPIPRYEGYQARELHLQNGFDPQERGQYLGSYLTFDGDKTVAKMSARALHELLAGKIDLDAFERQTRLRDIFLGQLTTGKAISNIRLEKGGHDNDDDYVEIEFGSDPAVGDFYEP